MISTEACTCPPVWWGINPPEKCAACQAGTYKFTSAYLSPFDIERIAQRVAELLKGNKP